MGAVVIPVGTRVLVIGGEEGADLTPVNDLWIFELEP
jgi:hypothetical protein